MKNCEIPQDIYKSVQRFCAEYRTPLCKINPDKIAGDLLNPLKAELQADILSRYVNLEKKKVLEIGSGYGVNHIVWTKKYHIDGYGLEPGSEGFESSFDISRELIKYNGLDPTKILDSEGEKIPFNNDSFDIVYSTNVLEHVKDPYLVLEEALRVLRVGGVGQFVYPNYLSYFDGHYAVFHPPVLFKGFFPWYVKNVFGRDPAFSYTLNTQLNPIWTKRSLAHLSKKYNFKVISFGEDIYFERMRLANFEGWSGLYKVKQILKIFQTLKINTFIGKIIYHLQGWGPIILTIEKI